MGRVIQGTEPGWDLVECFDAARNTCPIDGVCGLKGALKRAQTAFLGRTRRSYAFRLSASRSYADPAVKPVSRGKSMNRRRLSNAESMAQEHLDLAEVLDFRP